jgi:hypothetical protein
MRTLHLIVPVAALASLAACSVETDRQNGQTTVSYDQPELDNALTEVGNAAEQAADEIRNTAESASDAIENTDIDVNVRRDDDRAGNSQ